MEVQDGCVGNGDGDGVVGSSNASAPAKGPKSRGRKATARKTTGGQPPPAATGRNKRNQPDDQYDDHAEPDPTTPPPAKRIRKPASATGETPGPAMRSDRSKGAKKPPAGQKQN